VSGLYLLGLAVAVGLFGYLVWALFRPEDFS
jgi:K+-transporting ATPase KdpF subunit